MCGISGFLKLKGNDDGGKYMSSEFVSYFTSVNEKIVQRGPDAFGIWATDLNMFCEEKTRIVEIDDWGHQFHRVLHTNPTLALVNFRGIPTTEFLRPNARPNQLIQPYHDDDHNMIVTHNGQLSNDQELTKHMPTIMGGQDNDIDSYAFVKLISAIPFSEILLKVDGSYALAAYDRRQQRLYFARNFRGLYFSFWCGPEGDEYIVWSSEEESLVDADHRERYTIVEMPPYSFQGFNIWNFLQWRDKEDLFSRFMKDFVTLDDHQKIKTGYNKNTAVVVFSGGLDSTVCATMACAEYKTVHLLHFKYGARAEEQEIKSVTEIAHFLKAKFPETNLFLKFIDMDFIKNLGGSTLTDHTLSIAQGELGVETDHEWVPARNIAMIGLTTSYCDRYDIGNIILGLNMEEGSVFCDNSVEFYKAMEKALNLGSHSRPKMLMPVGNMMKHHIYKKGVDIGAPLHLSWSCYEGGEERCGTCGPCTMRRRAAAMNGIRDNVLYKNQDIEAEKILQYYGTKT